MSEAQEPVSPESSSSFRDLGLDVRLLEQLEVMGFEAPTPIQAAAMPPLLAGRDIIGRARTGSGKTAAFGLPLLERVKEGGGGVRALVLTPTRELAKQIGEALRTHAAKLPRVRGVTIYGGAPYPPQIKALKRGCSIVVGTPGRVIDLLEGGSLDLSRLEMFVLDEADEMLRMGFIDAVEQLFKETPSGRQVALFSATMPPPIRKVARSYLVDPIEVQVEAKALSASHIKQRWLLVPGNRKVEGLHRVLQASPRGSTLIFARTRATCSEIAQELCRRGYVADALHGDLNQSARERVLRRLRSGELNLVVATDVAARGLDVPNLSHVINLDLPESKEVYVHRIGRTGRAGRSGTATSLVTPNQQRFMRHVEQALDVKIPRVPVPSDAQITILQRGRLAEQLAAADESSTEGHRWLSELMAERDWTADEVGARALELLAGREGISLAAEMDCDDQPPAWSRGQSRPAASPGRGGRRNHVGDADEVQVFVAVGRRHGTRPADLVGALANEAGISGRKIGRIHIAEGASFVGLPRSEAEALVKKYDKINVRGIDATIDISRTRPPGEGRGGGNFSRGPGGPPKEGGGPSYRRKFGRGPGGGKKVASGKRDWKVRSRKGR
ncbi:MAG: DEAD/DEAH box helicase [Myxococcota bacterium]|nr:DEAD/DEAH box helicase [Myxococcota bacterium]